MLKLPKLVLLCTGTNYLPVPVSGVWRGGFSVFVSWTLPEPVNRIWEVQRLYSLVLCFRSVFNILNCSILWTVNSSKRIPEQYSFL